jgi:hypothetical protein
VSGNGPQGGGKGDWKKVRKGGRLAFHGLVTGASIVVCVVAEALGNLTFRGGVGLGRQTIDAALFGLLAGNLLALWLWTKQDAESS